MSQAKEGDTVNIHYTGKLDDGTVFDSSQGRAPLKFTLGEGQVIPGFENAVSGMSAGESKTVTIPSIEAYGPHHKEMLAVVDKGQFPDELDPKVGMQFNVPMQDGTPVTVTVTEVAETTVTLDANHPLAGKDLTFDIELVEIL